MNGRDEWHGEAMSTINDPGSGVRAAQGGREGSNQRGSDAPAQDAVERHEPAATEHASREIPEQEACGEDDAGRSGIVPGPDQGRHVVTSMNRLLGGIRTRRESARYHGALAKTGCRYAES